VTSLVNVNKSGRFCKACQYYKRRYTFSKSTMLIISTSPVISVRLDNIVQCLRDLINPTSTVNFVSLVNIMQSSQDLIKPTSPVIFARLVDIIQRTPDLITPTSPVTFARLVDTTGPYKVQKYGKFRKAG
jgi:hypothetical protein